jgi:hypothetical protein
VVFTTRVTNTSMKSIIFWDVTPCSLLRCNRRFGGTITSIFRVKENFSKNQQVSRWRYVPLKRQLHLNRLHGVTSQKMILFTTTAVKTSNPTNTSMLQCWKRNVWNETYTSHNLRNTYLKTCLYIIAELCVDLT